MTRLLLSICGILTALFAIFVTVGILAPPEYDGSMTVMVPATPKQVWDFLLDIEAIPEHRSDIDKVEMLLSDDQDHPHWRQFPSIGGSAVFEVSEAREPVHLSIHMRESSIGMTGSWIYDLQATNGGTIVTMFEHSRIDQLLARSLFTIMGRRSLLRRDADILRTSLPR